MSEWTETARRTLEDYCARSKAVLAGTGADADEVVEDLRRHVEEEVSAARLTIVTENDIRRILTRFGEPGSAIEKKSDAPQPAAPSPSGRDPGKKRPGFVLLLLGVILPLGTLIFELVTGASAGVLFDPAPDWFHVAIITLVPAVNFWIWRAGRARDSRHATALGWLNGAAIGICLFYSLRYLPFAPFAMMGVIYFGLGLVPLAPFIALMATPWLRSTYSQQIAREKLPGAGWGMLAAIGVLALLQMPVALTYYGLDRASSDDKQTKMHGVRVLRTFGDQELMLRACYGLLRREVNLDLVRTLASGDRSVTTDQAREIFYRVTGKPFNSVPPPSLYTRNGRWRVLEEEFTWDQDLGGEAVAGRVKGLSLLSSRQDAVAEPDSALVYCEWTLEFKNVSSQAREARAQIALPPGSVVSRLTLWINGEEREAAFGGRSQVRQAYQEVAVVQRHDPVLVTTCGPDRVLVQCFPVPAEGGVMKVRLGITAPLILNSLEEGRFLWPRFLERNFAVAADFKHALWIESPMPLSGDTNSVASEKTKSGSFTLRESLLEEQWAESAKYVAVRRAAPVITVWSPASTSGRVIRQSIQPWSPSLPSRLVLVLDGSFGMERAAREMTEALSELPATVEVAVVIAGDEARVLSEKPQKATPEVLRELERQVRRRSFAGGEDNLPALELGWNLAAAVPNGAVVWIHQPQPALLSPESALRQCLERMAAPTRLYEIQIRNGADRIIEKLDGLAIEHVPRLGSLRSDFSALLAGWSGKSPRFELVREETAASPDITSRPRVGQHLERLWARDEAIRLAARRNRDAAVKVAAEHQLVTPMTGAVVLETQQQFSRHGLSPAASESVPSVPEPQTSTLLGVGMVAWIVWRYIRRTRRSGGDKCRCRP